MTWLKLNLLIRHRQVRNILEYFWILPLVHFLVWHEQAGKEYSMIILNIAIGPFLSLARANMSRIFSPSGYSLQHPCRISDIETEILIQKCFSRILSKENKSSSYTFGPHHIKLDSLCLYVSGHELCINWPSLYFSMSLAICQQ